MIEPILLQGNLSRRQAETKACELLEKTGLPANMMSRYPHQLSGGQKQRVAIARALMNDPRFIICDEPLSALDVSVQAQVVALLQDIRRTSGISLLFIAHDLAMVHYICDRIAVMHQGRIIECDTADTVIHHPYNEYTKQLIAAHHSPSIAP